MPREHGESGEFVETITLADVLGVFDAVDGPVVLSADVADTLDCSRETARRKLETLHDRGELERRKVARRVIYWEAESGRETDESAPATQGGPSHSSPLDAHESGQDAGEIAAALERWTHGRSEQERDASQTVAVRATEWLRDRGDAVRKADVPLDDLTDVDPQDRDPDTLWTQVVRDAWQHAAERGYVEQPHARAYRWGGAGDGQDGGREV